MRKKKGGFNFKWKVAENYSAAIVGAIFLWFFIDGIVNGVSSSLTIAVIILILAPLLVTFVDKKSSKQ